MRVLIAGCGDLGSRAGLKLAALGHTVFGLRRNADRIPAPIVPIRGDLLHLAEIALPPLLDAVVVALTPDERSAAGYQRTYVAGVEALQADKRCAAPMVFVSSTAVYGDHHGNWVDESSLCAPDGFNGQVLLNAEHLLTNDLVLRLGGIYGPGREWMIRRARAGGSASSVRWTNRIHVDDAAGVIAQAVDQQWTAGILNVVDTQPTLESEVLSWLANALNAAPPQLNADPVSDNKKVRCEKLIGRGFVHRYPSFCDGYASMLRQSAEPTD